jgi:hypothetical protein
MDEFFPMSSRTHFPQIRSGCVTDAEPDPQR